MAEETKPAPSQGEQQTTVVSPGQQEGQQTKVDPFDEKNWSDKPIEAPASSTPPASTTAEPPKTDTSTTPPPAKPQTDEAIDADEFFQKELGVKSVAEAKAELQRLRELEKAPASQRGSLTKEAIKKMIEEKEDHIYSHISNKRLLNNLQALDPADVSNAGKILKADIKLKNPQLSDDEVDLMYNREYRVPAKPVQGEDETDGDFNSRVSAWEGQKSEVESWMKVQAKLVKPNLLKQSNELDLPDIPITPATESAEPTAEELQKMQQDQAAFNTIVEKGVADFKGFDVEYKGEEATIPLSYQLSPEEKANVQAKAQSLFTSWDYILDRWKNPDGTYDGAKIARDIALLEYGGNVHNKFVKEAAEQRLEQHIKAKSNIVVDGSLSTQQVPGGQENPVDALLKQVWGG